MSSILTALQNVLADPQVVLIVFLSACFGVFVGSIPGLTATMAVALLVPITYWLDPVAALAAVVSVVACAIFAGDIPNTLLRIPGTPASAAYANDAHNLTRQGKSNLVLGTALICSVGGGIFGAIVLMLLGHQLAKVATSFSAVEYFWLYLLGLSCAVVVSSGPKLNGLLALTIGLLISTVGLSAVHSKARFTFGVAELYGGINFIPAMIGLFGISEVLSSLLVSRRSSLEGQETEEGAPHVHHPSSVARPSLLSSGAGMLFRRPGHALGSASIGSLIGMLPGAGADIAAWVSFAVSKRFSKRPQLYGRESIEGIADATTANNAALAGAWIPALILGIPGDSVTAIVIGVLLMKNITPGPDIFVKQTELVYSIYLIFILANIMLIPVGFIAVKAASRLVRIPKAILLPAIVLFCIVGSYSLNASYIDVTVMLVMGVLGFLLERRRVPLAPIVLALILGPMIEERFIQIITGSDGSFTGFVNPQRPLALALAGVFALVWISAIVIGVSPIYRRERRDRGGF